MAKAGQFRILPDGEGGVLYERYGYDSSIGEARWAPQTKKDMEGLTMSGAPITKRNANMSKVATSNAIQRAKTQSMAHGEREKIVDDIGFGEKAAIIAGREVDKLGAGTADLIDFARDISKPAPAGGKYDVGVDLGDKLSEMALGAIPDDMPILGTTPKDIANVMLGPAEEGGKRTFDRMEDQEQKDEMYKELGDQAGLAGIAAIAPYYVTGTALPAATKGVGAALRGAKETVKKGATEVGGLMGRAIRRQAAKTGDNVPTKVAKELEDIVLKPLDKMVTASKARPAIKHEFREGAASQLGGAAALGAAEGGIHYDESIAEGASNSALGSALGKFYEPFVARAPSKVKAGQQEVLDWAKSKGYRALPGTRTGQPKYQAKESGLRNDERYSGPMKQLDDANDEVVTRLVGETMGVDNLHDVTADTLKAHRASLKSQYNDLEAATVGRIDKGRIKDLEASVAGLPDTKDGRNAQKTMSALIDDIKGMNKPGGRDTRGRVKQYTFNGKDYQSTRRILKDHADTAYGKNKTLHRQLKDAIKVLDDGMEAGIEKHGGKASSAQWRDLNEKYAMTKLVMEKGMNPDYTVNLGGLAEHFKANDMERMLLNEGGRIDNLHRLTQLNDLQKKGQGSGLAGPGVEHTEKAQKTEKARLLNTPSQLNTSLPRWAMLRAYQKGIPSTTGLMNLRRGGRGSAPALSRMIEQGTDAHQDAYDKLIDIGGSAVDTTSDAWTQLMDKLGLVDYSENEGVK